MAPPYFGVGDADFTSSKKGIEKKGLKRKSNSQLWLARFHQCTHLPNCKNLGTMGETADEYPEVQGGGSLILAWQIKGKKVLVVGGGEVRWDSLLLEQPRKQAPL